MPEAIGRYDLDAIAPTRSAPMCPPTAPARALQQWRRAGKHAVADRQRGLLRVAPPRPSERTIVSRSNTGATSTANAAIPEAIERYECNAIAPTRSAPLCPPMTTASHALQQWRRAGKHGVARRRHDRFSIAPPRLTEHIIVSAKEDTGSPRSAKESLYPCASRVDQPANPPSSRKACSSGVVTRPNTALRWGKSPKRRTISA